MIDKTRYGVNNKFIIIFKGTIGKCNLYSLPLTTLFNLFSVMTVVSSVCVVVGFDSRPW